MNIQALLEELRSPEAKKKFRELMMKYHPDKKGGSKVVNAINNE